MCCGVGGWLGGIHRPQLLDARRKAAGRYTPGAAAGRGDVGVRLPRNGWASLLCSGVGPHYYTLGREEGAGAPKGATVQPGAISIHDCRTRGWSPNLPPWSPLGFGG